MIRVSGGKHGDADDKALARFRALCLSFPETTEVSSWGHPNFRTRQRIFATYEVVHRRPSMAFRLDPVDVDLLLHRKHFFATPYGRGQWVSLWADGRINWREVRQLLGRSYRLAQAPRARSQKSEARSPKLRLRQGYGGQAEARSLKPEA